MKLSTQLSAALFICSTAIAAQAWACNSTGYESRQRDPQATLSSIDGASGHYQHWIYQANAYRKNVLLVFIGGSLSTPWDYQEISQYAANLGYDVINLRYKNNEIPGLTCSTNDVCFTNIRGEVAFGNGVSYASGTYSSSIVSVDSPNSILNRIVAAIDDSANYHSTDSCWTTSYWTQYLTATASSPYVTQSGSHTLPDWSKIILAGHSQGSGEAAFIAVHLPSSGPAPLRVLLFSGPNDSWKTLIPMQTFNASWLSDASRTPMNRYWGLKLKEEGMAGAHTFEAWALLGGITGTNIGGVGGEGGETSTDIFDGGTSGGGAHRLYMESDEPHSTQHNASAADSLVGCANYPACRKSAWEYVITGGMSQPTCPAP